MSVNIAKNKDSLVAAWRNVVDDKLPINWALFGYEGQTNNLKVVGSGDGGLEEMIEELNTSQVMYAFCRVIDTKTSLPKCLLINWQGEGAPIVRKGTCANHIRDIEKLLKGAHITLNARSEEEVEVELIMEKLARATGSAYKFNEPRGENGGQLGPVGTTYRRVIPEQEINATERDQFWQREEIEEKQRLEQERVRWEEERQRVEREIRSREEKESQLREKQVSAKETIVAKQRQAEQRAEEIKNLRNQPTPSETRNVDSDEERKSRSEELRKQRSRETQQLIAQRTINARAVFEQNSAAGQMRAPINQQQKSAPKSNHVEAARRVIEQQSQEVSAPKVQPEVIAMAQPKAEESPQVQAVPDSAIVTAAPIQVDEEKAHTQPQQQQPQPQQQESEQTSTTSVEETENELYSQLEGGPYLYFDPNNEGMKARALYDYQAADDTEITFDPGDIITHIDAIDEGWWQGLGPDGTYGLFPANYVEVIEFHNA